ncbi:hypothetical protein [Photobacterium leiognathi]|uniref:hypothetical protein n=1 Tax=Photobacterium leiognathi TaxID=553611 RepID=UPI00298231AA|nr:hypothetical protein [Photobacterium leiognathi]
MNFNKEYNSEYVLNKIKSTGVTASQLSKLGNITYPAAHRIINGKRKLSPTLAELVCIKLGLVELNLM